MVEPSGKRVVIVWNEHPTEVVAGFHARKVAKILRDKYGHEVVMEKIPVKETNYGIITIRNRPKKRVEALKKLKTSLHIAHQLSAKHGAITFNFHCSPAKSFNRYQIDKDPEEFTVGETEISEYIPNEFRLGFHAIQILRQKNGAIIEIPANFTPISPTIAKRRTKLIKKTLETLGDNIYSMHGQDIKNHTASEYQLMATKLKDPQQKKYLHPAISEKIAAAIHERISRK